MANFSVCTAHPRLLTTDSTFSKLKKNSCSPLGKLMAAHIVYQANLLLNKPVRKFNIQGRSALGDVRSAYRYVMTLTVAYRLSGDSRYLERVKKELMSWCELEHWNPSHFLDTAECTMFLSLAYDWLYHDLDIATRKAIEQAILQKGLIASWADNEEWNHWVDGYNNWVQVCHAGMTAGALAIYEIAPELAQQTIERALKFVPKIMQKSYAPCGTYPEGPVYWGYGTDFNSLLIGVLESACGSSFGLTEQPGFSETGSYFVSMLASDGGFFNFSDCRVAPEGYFAETFLIDRFKTPEFYTPAFSRLLEGYANRRDFDDVGSSSDRHFPVTLLYIDALPSEPNSNPPRNYFSTNDALQPLVVHRSGGENGVYLGLKGGSPGNSHGHMDGGSFLYLVNQVRWAIDPGMPDYALEKFVSLWDLSQESSRWSVFKVGHRSHNIIVINEQDQLCSGRAVFQSFDPLNSSSVINLSTLYANSASKVLRRCAINSDNSLTVSDSIFGLQPATPARFQFCTDADAIVNAGTIELSKAGKRLRVESNLQVEWQVTPGSDIIEPFDTPCPELKIISFELCAPINGELSWIISFIPQT